MPQRYPQIAAQYRSRQLGPAPAQQDQGWGGPGISAALPHYTNPKSGLAQSGMTGTGNGMPSWLSAIMGRMGGGAQGQTPSAPAQTPSSFGGSSIMAFGSGAGGQPPMPSFGMASSGNPYAPRPGMGATNSSSPAPGMTQIGGTQAPSVMPQQAAAPNYGGMAAASQMGPQINYSQSAAHPNWYSSPTGVNYGNTQQDMTPRATGPSGGASGIIGNQNSQLGQFGQSPGTPSSNGIDPNWFDKMSLVQQQGMGLGGSVGAPAQQGLQMSQSPAGYSIGSTSMNTTSPWLQQRQSMPSGQGLPAGYK